MEMSQEKASLLKVLPPNVLILRVQQYMYIIVTALLTPTPAPLLPITLADVLSIPH